MAHILAKLCYERKQHFANVCRETGWMPATPINQVLADNLKHYMLKNQLTQSSLGERAGLGQTTVSLYLTPSRRQASKSGKVPSAKLSEVESLAHALGVDVWRLLRPFTDKQRKAYDKIEEAYQELLSLTTPEAEENIVKPRRVA
ncbi:MAG: helix-turn-helix transcriptional regulator [Polaromonas sp.]|uniref:helix-turn-helix domain-containing protein n=1 Tax=Polaromonas sp. TaxID=1869339 RepID=UPI0025D2EFDC|nr:helix-turn-helix transcriptional regulator [Polaromonas sp.]MBI2725423.1 helix-turn-helix transcriptional regulator [Polaromonas sp.]